MGEEVKAKKATSSGARVRSRDKCAREKHRSAQRDHKVEGGADDAALLSNIVRFFSAPAALGLHRRAVSHRASAPLSVVYRTDLGNGTTARRSIPFSHTKPEKHKDRFNTFRLIRQRDQRKSFRFFKKHKG